MSHNKKIAAVALGFMLALTGVAQAETAGQYIDDSTATTKVKAALVGDKNIPSGDISVVTEKGVVTLSGNVDTAVQAALAVKDAMSVSGVQSVQNNLTVHQSQPKL